MTMPVVGNAVVVNFLMRFPVLIPVAAAAGIATAVTPPVEAPKPPVAVVQKVEPAPVVVVPKALETLCPPVEKTVHLSKKEKKVLIDKGCKIKG